MIDISEIRIGESYACRFKIETMLDEFGSPAGGNSNTPIKGPGLYEGIGVIQVRDVASEQVKLKDEKSGKEFVVPFADIWDIDTAEFADD